MGHARGMPSMIGFEWLVAVFPVVSIGSAAKWCVCVCVCAPRGCAGVQVRVVRFDSDRHDVWHCPTAREH
eukprot:1184704-Prorocentrum_minimum.AAC.4